MVEHEKDPAATGGETTPHVLGEVLFRAGPETPDYALSEIAEVMDGRRTAAYKKLDTFIEGVTPGSVEFQAFSDWAAFYRAQGDFDRLDAQIMKREMLEAPNDPLLEAASERAYNRLQKVHKRNGENEKLTGYLPVIGQLETVFASSLLGAEEAQVKLTNADPKKPSTWRSVGIVGEADIRKNPEAPTFHEVKAIATQNFAAELKMRVAKINNGYPSARPKTAPQPKR